MVSVDVKHHVYLLNIDSKRLVGDGEKARKPQTQLVISLKHNEPQLGALVQDQHTRELISARKTSHKYNNKS